MHGQVCGMRAEIVSIGTELLLGTITDTNASYLARRLAGLGIDCYYISQVGDNMDRLKEVLQRAWSRSDLTVTTGGLGPTGDDLTREAIAEMLGESLVVDEQLAEHVRQFFAGRGLQMPERNLKQAALIPSARSVENPVGTAPGWWVGFAEEAAGGPMIVSMPGVPFEMRRMWEQEVEPHLRTLNSTVIVSRTLKVLGLGESAVEQRVADLMSGANPTLAPYAKQDGVHLRITAKASDDAAARVLIAPIEAAVRERLGNTVYGADEITPGEVVRALLHLSKLTLALVEVGEGSVGAVSPVIGADPAVVAVYSAPDGGQSRQVLGAADSNLDELAKAALRKSGAEMALAIMSAVRPAGEGAVQAQAFIMVLSSQGQGRRSINGNGEVSQVQWTTAPSEVTRLIGLAALNQLRLALLSI